MFFRLYYCCVLSYFIKCVLLSRPQYTEEKIGSAEKTELDRHFESLSLQADAARQWTEKLVAGAEAVLIPNPGECGILDNHKVAHFCPGEI